MTKKPRLAAAFRGFLCRSAVALVTDCLNVAQRQAVHLVVAISVVVSANFMGFILSSQGSRRQATAVSDHAADESRRARDSPPGASTGHPTGETPGCADWFAALLV